MVPGDGPIPVTFVASHAGRGGSERYLEVLLAGLGSDWVDVVIALEDGPAVDRLCRRGVPVEVVPAGRRAGLLLGAWRLRRRLARRRPTLVHANGIKAALVTVLALAGSDIPVLWVKHDFSWDGPLARAVAAACSEVVGVSEVVLGTLRRSRPWGLPRPRLVVVPNGVPGAEGLAPSARAALRAELGVPAEAELVALVGRLHPAKGQAELVEALPTILAARQAVRVLLVGADDPAQAAYGDAVRARISALGLGERVRLTGHRDDARAIISAADLLVLPSVADARGMGREGFGLTGVEALAAGTPVVGYADGALPEILGPAAVLVSPGDRLALARAIADLLAQPSRRSELAAAGRSLQLGRYGIETMLAAMRRRYRRAVQRDQQGSLDHDQGEIRGFGQQVVGD